MYIVVTKHAISVLDHWPTAADYPLDAWGVFARSNGWGLCWARIKRTSTGKHIWHEKLESQAPAKVKAAVFLMK